MTSETLPQRRFSRLRGRQGRAVLRIGCLPAVITGSLTVIAGAGLMTYLQIPYWVSARLSYLAETWFAAAEVTLLGVQLIYGWVAGLVAAANGTQAARAGGQWFKNRLTILRKRMRIIPTGQVALRLLIILLLPVFLLLFRHTSLSTDTRRVAGYFWRLWRVQPVLTATAAALLVIFWFASPFLRMQFSLALGALAAAWHKEREGRRWMALSARLGAELFGTVSLMWGGLIVLLLALSIFDPTYNSPDRFPELFADYSTSTRALASVALGMLVTLPPFLLVQALLPGLFARLARRRLSKES